MLANQILDKVIGLADLNVSYDETTYDEETQTASCQISGNHWAELKRALGNIAYMYNGIQKSTTTTLIVHHREYLSTGDWVIMETSFELDLSTNIVNCKTHPYGYETVTKSGTIVLTADKKSKEYFGV